MVIKKELKKLDFYFHDLQEEITIAHAIKDGYIGTDIAEYLGVTKASVSKAYTNHKQKIKFLSDFLIKDFFGAIVKM